MWSRLIILTMSLSINSAIPLFPRLYQLIAFSLKAVHTHRGHSAVKQSEVLRLGLSEFRAMLLPRQEAVQSSGKHLSARAGLLWVQTQRCVSWGKLLFWASLIPPFKMKRISTHLTLSCRLNELKWAKDLEVCLRQGKSLINVSCCYYHSLFSIQQPGESFENISLITSLHCLKYFKGFPYTQNKGSSPNHDLWLASVTSLASPLPLTWQAPASGSSHLFFSLHEHSAPRC